MVLVWSASGKPSFYEGKVGFWLQNHLFTRKKLVFVSKTIFLRGKSWFSYEEPSFYEAKPKKTSFSTSPPHSLKKMVFLVFWFCLVKDGFGAKKPTFTSQKDGFPEAVQTKTIFLRGKSWFSYEEPSFYEAKPKKPSFSTSPPHSLKKMVFLVFWFCLVKDGFGAKNQLLPRKKMVFLCSPDQKHLFTWEKLVFL